MLPTAALLLADTAGSTGSTLGTLLPLLLFGAVMWFLIVRPQRKRQQEAQELQESLAVGADVVTVGGLHGRIEDMGEEYVDLAVDEDGTVLRFQRSAIARTIGGDAQAEPLDDDAATDED